MSLYGTSAVRRLAGSAADDFDRRLMGMAHSERPTSVRGMYYMSMGAGFVDKDGQSSRSNYMRVQRRILALRRDGVMPYSWITDGSRIVYGNTQDLRWVERDAAPVEQTA